MDYGLGEQFKVKASGDEAEVVIPDICKTDERWLVAKFRIVADMRELNLLKKIRFVEEYEKKEEKKEEAKKEEAKPEEAHDHEHEEKPEEKPVKKAAPAKRKEKSTEEERPKEEKSPEEL
jgi:outer membrane biosynthesis protein TonB